MANFRRSRSVVRPPKRTSLWLGINFPGAVVAGNAKVLLGSLTAGALLLRPFTVVRTRCLFTVESDQTSVSETPAGAMGFLVVQDQAISTGSAALPDPSSDTDAAWFVYEAWRDSFLFATAVGFESHGDRQYSIDSKSMRKVGSSEDIAVMFRETASVGVLTSMRGRVLIKLH